MQVLLTQENAPESHGPELFIALAGAVGTDLAAVFGALEQALSAVTYTATDVHLSSLLEWVDLETLPGASIDDSTFDRHVATRMEVGDLLREKLGRGDAVALLGILQVKRLRDDPEMPRPRTAYVFRSLKHPQEVDTLREVYGPNFFLISAYSPTDTRASDLETRIAADWELHGMTPGESSAAGTARDLIERDRREENRRHGQRLGDTFPLADFFVDARDHQRLQSELTRFIEMLFDHPFHTPTRAENAMFHAQAAALRSAAPGRQVGAVITTPDGSIVAVGTNEVPKAGGGQYWSDDEVDWRDHKRPDRDVSGSEKRTVIAQVFRRLKEAGWLKDEQAATDSQEFGRLLEGLRIHSLVEFERAVHAEMSAIIDASRRGVAVDGSYLYSTTFPCHECTRHIIASGIERVFYIHPYPKSLASKLHNDSIEIDPDRPSDGMVSFSPFVGVAPRRYLDLFSPSPGSRKDDDGRVAADKARMLPKSVPAAQA